MKYYYDYVFYKATKTKKHKKHTHTHLLTKMFIYIIFKNKKQNKINKLN